MEQINKIYHIIGLTMVLLTIVTFTSCSDKISAEVPSYIEINSFDYEGNQHENPPYPDNYHSTNITDAWISMDGEVIGNFEIPCKIPILSDGNHTFYISPGIKKSGQTASRIIYPYYVKDTIETTLIRDESIQLEPKTYYKNNLANPLFNTQGTFENTGGGTMFEVSPTTASNINAVIQNDVVFQGDYSAAIFFDNDNNYCKIRNNSELELKNGTFLELNFLSTINFNIGLSIINNGNSSIDSTTIQLYPTSEWKKIYIDLTNEIALGNNSSKFKIYFEAQSNKDDTIYIDNLKLTYML